MEKMVMSRGLGPIMGLSIASMVAASALAVAAVIAGNKVVTQTQTSTPAPADRCALPAGIDFSLLQPVDQDYAMRRQLLCSDLEHNRISLADYQQRVRALDERPRVEPEAVISPPAPPALEWATSVRNFSSQYSAPNWAAIKVLGAPDVYPSSGDNVNAWASRDADQSTEFLEVGYDQPVRGRALHIFETYNPGAISKVEITTADGVHRTVYTAKAAPMQVAAFERKINLDGCTASPVVDVKVTLDSGAVPGWNEIDAIGVEPCQ
jgi:hypothetical protein